jgi:ribulose-5-phosphate 4-epimerase/fuculose-1-phosphate aldolase
MHFALNGETYTETLRWFAEGLEQLFERNGYRPASSPPEEDVRIVFNFVDPSQPKPYRRRAKATYVVSIAHVDSLPEDVLRFGYPLLVRTLSNLFILLTGHPARATAYFITLEQGYYAVDGHQGSDKFFDEVFRRLEPLATSTLVIDNEFVPDLPEDLWDGDDITRRLSWAARKVAEMNLWPAPFPIQELLPPEDFRHVQRLYGIGGLSYGNLSARKDRRRFWMSASGVNKARLERVGEHILLVDRYDPDKKAIRLSVPRHVKPRRVSVDAIEHWMIYQEHPDVGAIVHIHAWMEGVPSTQVNYPCGTVELARTVAELVRQADNPARAVIGLKNHGLTITGPDLDDIFERIEGKIIPQVPMS